jgi:hypothetical protein
MSVSAGTIMDAVAAHSGDAAKTLLTYTNQLPFLKTAVRDLEIICASYDIPVLTEVSSVQDVAAAATVMPSQPTDIIVPVEMFERQDGSTLAEDWTPMERVTVLPNRTANEKLGQWEWREEVITFIGASTAREVKLVYKRLLAAIADENSTILLNYATNYLIFQTAFYIARDFTKADNDARTFEKDAILNKDLMVGIGVKSNQAFPRRRRRYSSKFKLAGRRPI